MKKKQIKMIISVTLCFIMIGCISGCKIIESMPFVYPYITAKKVKLQGTLETKIIQGGKSGKELELLIYLPNSYHLDTLNYPVIYHLHGASPDKSPIDIAKKDAYLIAEHLELAIEEKIAKPMIIVVPKAINKMGLWCDSYDGKYMDETALIKDIVPYIDQTYRTIKSRENRTIQGFSMGGFGAVKTFAKYPSLFSVLVNFDGAMHDWETLNKSRENISIKMFDQKEANFNSFSPCKLIQSNAEHIRNHSTIISYIGLLEDYNRKLETCLSENNIEQFYKETGFKHNLYKIMDAYYEDIFKSISTNMKN